MTQKREWREHGNYYSGVTWFFWIRSPTANHLLLATHVLVYGTVVPVCRLESQSSVFICSGHTQSSVRDCFGLRLARQVLIARTSQVTMLVGRSNPESAEFSGCWGSGFTSSRFRDLPPTQRNVPPPHNYCRVGRPTKRMICLKGCQRYRLVRYKFFFVGTFVTPGIRTTATGQ